MKEHVNGKDIEMNFKIHLSIILKGFYKTSFSRSKVDPNLIHLLTVSFNL